MNISATQFDGKDIRRVYDEASETWWFSVVGVVQVLTESRSARRYWSDLKRKLAQEAGSEQLSEKIVQLNFLLPVLRLGWLGEWTPINPFQNLSSFTPHEFCSGFVILRSHLLLIAKATSRTNSGPL
jgi:hypothetical protein